MRKTYSKPECLCIEVEIEDLLVTASDVGIFFGDSDGIDGIAGDSDNPILTRMDDEIWVEE